MKKENGSKTEITTLTKCKFTMPLCPSQVALSI